jgi:hypothetical protein
VQSVPRFIAALLHANAGNTVINEEIPMPLLDFGRSPCRGLAADLASNSSRKTHFWKN